MQHFQHKCTTVQRVILRVLIIMKTYTLCSKMFFFYSKLCAPSDKLMTINHLACA